MKKYIKSHFKRFKRLALSLTVFALIFSCCFVATASFNPSINMPISQPNITGNTFYVEVLYNNGVSGELDIISYTTTDGDTAQPCIYVYFNGSNELTFSGTGLLPKLNCYWITSAGNCGVYNNGGGSFSITYPNVVGVKLYGNFELKAGSAPLPNVYAWNFNYSSDAVAINQLNTIIDLLSQTNSPSYSAPNTSITDDYTAAEQEVNTLTKPGVDSVTSFFNSFTVTDGNMFRGLLAVTEIFEEYVNLVPVFGELARFSVMLGLFAFILGLVVIISRHRPSDMNGYTVSERGSVSDEWAREHL